MQDDGFRTSYRDVVLAVVPAAAAQAKLVGEFDAAIRNVRPWGATRSSPPRASTTPPESRRRAWPARPSTSRAGRRSVARFCRAGTGATARSCSVEPGPRALPNAEFASGSLLLDARPAIEEPVPASVWLFLRKGGEARRRGPGIVILVRANERSPAWNYDVLHGYLVREPRARPGFGYRLELPTTLQPLLPQVTLSLIEMKLRIPGAADRYGACASACAGPTAAASRVASQDQAELLAQGAGLPAGPQGRVRRRLCVPRREPDLEAAQGRCSRFLTTKGQGKGEIPG